VTEQQYPEPIVGAFIQNQDQEFLFFKSPKWNDKWTIPGGHIEIGETLRDALKREVMDEVGLEIEVKIPIQIQEGIFPKSFTKKKHFIFHTYLCDAVSNTVKLDQREAVEHKWAKLEEAKKLDLEEFTLKVVDTYLALQNMAKGQL